MHLKKMFVIALRKVPMFPRDEKPHFISVHPSRRLKTHVSVSER